MPNNFDRSIVTLINLQILKLVLCLTKHQPFCHFPLQACVFHGVLHTQHHDLHLNVTIGEFPQIDFMPGGGGGEGRMKG